MINRELIRLKAVQIAYAYYENEGKTVETAEKELFFSLTKAYDLYRQMLLLLVSLNNIATRTVETQQARANRIGEDTVISRKFITNKFITQLEQNEELCAFRDAQAHSWLDEDEFLRQIYARLCEQDFYIEYMHNDATTYEDDRDVWRKLYRTLLCNNEELDGMLEEMSLYWNDDKPIVDAFVLKTIKRFDEANGSQQPLLPEFGSEADRDFAGKLFRSALENEDTYRDLIARQVKHWDLGRMARMDVVILQLALSEMINFPEIPLNVTINEYVEIAKAYSTPRSGGYINAVLDGAYRRMVEEKTLAPKTNK